MKRTLAELGLGCSSGVGNECGLGDTDHSSRRFAMSIDVGEGIQQGGPRMNLESGGDLSMSDATELVGGGMPVVNHPVTLQATPSYVEFDHSKISVVSWNIDGLNPLNRFLRSLAVVDTIREFPSDVILLQEVTPDQLGLFQEEFREDYVVLAENIYSDSRNRMISNIVGKIMGCPYFTVMLVRRAAFLGCNIVAKRIPFTGAAASQMGRDILVVEIEQQSDSMRLVGTSIIADVDSLDRSSPRRLGCKLLIVNLHLESCKESCFVRTEQLVQSMIASNLVQSSDKMMSKSSSDKGGIVTIVAGDLNLRNDEYTAAVKQLKSKGVACANIVDVAENYCEKLGLKLAKSNMNTWICPGSPHIRCRFDRMYCNSAQGASVEDFRLIGGKDIDNFRQNLDALSLSPEESSRLYFTASDHLGIRATIVLR